MYNVTIQNTVEALNLQRLIPRMDSEAFSVLHPLPWIQSFTND